MIRTDAVAKATPDGDTPLIVPTTFTVNAVLNEKLLFDRSAISNRSASWSRSVVVLYQRRAAGQDACRFVALAKSQPAN